MRLTCPTADSAVGTAEGLTAALTQARPGSVIALAAGTYSGRFVAKNPGTAEQPIWLCGSPGAVIDAGGITGGYGLHLDGADHWRVLGLRVTNAQKGVVLDGVDHAVLQGLSVDAIGDEAIHLRAHSSDNVVHGCTVSRTGLRREKFGEGIYVGTAVSNWKTITGGQPDRSDRNVVWGNEISATTAEAVDIKEGTTRGVVAHNTFDGSSLTGADSWVDVKGSEWLILGNRGVHSPLDGFQTHEILPGWGARNVFAGNAADAVAEKSEEGLGFALRPDRGTWLKCDNTVTGAALSNVACR